MIQKQAFANDVVLSCPQWNILDISFTITDMIPAPFDVRFGAEFTSDTGQTLYIPGFYNGDNS